MTVQVAVPRSKGPKPSRGPRLLERLAALAARRPRRVLVLTVFALVVAGVFGGPVAGLLSAGSNEFEDAGSQSIVARAELERAAGANPEVSLLALVTPTTRAKVEAVAAAIRRDPAVAQVFTAYNTGSRAFFSRDRSSTYLAASFKPIPVDQEQDVATRIERRLAHTPGVLLGGRLIAAHQVDRQVENDLAHAEALAFPLLLLLSLLVFRGLVAALLPLAGGLVSIVSTFLCLRIVNELTPLSIFALNLVTGLGLGLAIDYSLFIVSRYREELARVGPGPEALRRTLATAGRTVLFSSLTVAAALAALLAFPQPFLYSMGIGGILTALISAGNALIVLPAILAALGPRVNALAPARLRQAGERSARETSTGAWYRLAQAVMRRPAPVAAASAALLIALGVPFLGIRFTGVDASVLPTSASARQVSDALANRFPSNRAEPIYLAVTAGHGAGPQVRAYAQRLRRLPGVATVTQPQPLTGAWRIDVVAEQAALANSSKRLVSEIRNLDPPFPVRVGGETARFLDLQASLRSHLPLAIAILALTTFALLFAMTGSLVLPLKSLVMNLLTLSATFGLLVLVFQDGRLQGLLDYTSQGALESTQPILLAAIAFALSTDYAVFLLTRIKEIRDAGATNSEAVARGLERTGRIVTSAALLFCVAVGAFSTSQIVFIKELGLGMALAVIIDATIVRALLVPSLMKLLGRWNWWAPAPLQRLHTRLGLQET